RRSRSHGVERRARVLACLRAGFYDGFMTERARKLLEHALTLSDDERLDLAQELLSSLPEDPEWIAELERRARRALADPSGGRRGTSLNAGWRLAWRVDDEEHPAVNEERRCAQFSRSAPTSSS